MVDAWVPLSKLAVLADVSEPTTRRYVASKALSKFFRVRKEARLTLVHMDAVPILKRAYLLSCQGKKMEEIEASIPQEFPIVFDAEPSAPPPAQAPDLQSPPALPDILAALLPLAERFLTAYEAQTKALEALAAALAPNSPYKRTDQQRDGNGHGGVIEGQDKPQEGADMMPVDKEALTREVHRLRGMGYGAARIRTAMVKAGWGSLAGPGHKLSKSTVARIVKSNGGDAQ